MDISFLLIKKANRDTQKQQKTAAVTYYEQLRFGAAFLLLKYGFLSRETRLSRSDKAASEKENAVMKNLEKIDLVLCDDDPGDLEKLRVSAAEYINQRGLSCEMRCFSKPEDVLRYSETAECSVYLLDVIMPETDGITLGKKLRGRGKNSVVIYISSSREYALDAFSVHAFSYLIKPFSKEQLFSELDESFERLGASSRALSVKTAEETVLIDISEMIAVEYYAHRLRFHLANGETIESAYRREPFDVQAEDIMRTGDFLKASSSYLVNRRNIQGVLADEFLMCDGSRYKITRKYADARQKYISGEMSNK